MKLLLVRHGEIPSNVNKVYAGRSPEKLTKIGRVQAKEVSGKLRNYRVSALYSSPIQRAIETTGIIAGVLGLHYCIEESFRELEMGPWEGMAETEVARQYPEEWKVWNTNPADLELPGRETLQDLLERVLAGINEIYKINGKRTVVIVTHVAVIRVMLLWHEKRSLNDYKKIHVPNAGVFEMEIEACP